MDFQSKGFSILVMRPKEACTPCRLRSEGLSGMDHEISR